MTIRRSLISCLAIILYYSGMIFLYEKIYHLLFPKNKLMILMYHRVLDNNDASKEFQQGLYVTKKIFDEQIAYLSQNYNLISLEQAYDVFINNRKFPQNAVVITFDDGWVDNYTIAYPILKKYNKPATIFLTTDFIDTKETYWFYRIAQILHSNLLSERDLKKLIEELIAQEKIPEQYRSYMLENVSRFINEEFLFVSFLKNLNLEIIKLILSKIMLICQLNVDNMSEKSLNLNWEQIQEMSKNKISFGSHGKSHQIMTTLSQKEIIVELQESKTMIETKLDKTIMFYAYPNGNYNSLIKEEIKNAGYQCAITTSKNKKEMIDIYSLHRIGIHDNMSIDSNGNFSKSLFSIKINMSNYKYTLRQ